MIRHHRRQRGSIYITGLAAATMTAIRARAALRVARSERRSVEMVTSAQQARIAAHSAVEYVILRLNTDMTNWRSMFANDVWSPAVTLGDATIRFKIADESDGQLANNASDPATLTVRAVVGDAVRMYSVTIETYTHPAPSNLLLNGGMESGVTGWTADPAGQASLVAMSGSGAKVGSGYMRVANRLISTAGPAQPVTGLVNGQTYYTEVWLRTPLLLATASIAIELDTSYGAQTVMPTPALVGPSWTKVSGVLNVNWIGDLHAARWKISTLSLLTDLYVDEAVFIATSSLPPETRLVPGTWRQVIA